MSLNYLQLLNERYEDWIAGYEEGNLLIINSDDIDFVNKEEDWKHVINKINEALKI